jgi:HD-GYP domain-containing protein (c-di-GMP phosphodiesterase class II)
MVFFADDCIHNRASFMQLIPISVESITIGQSLPFPLMDKHGILLAKRGYLVDSKRDLLEIAKRGGGLFIDVADSDTQHRAYVERLHGLVRTGRSLGEIAKIMVAEKSAAERLALENERPDWLDLQTQGHGLLCDQHPANFSDRLARLQIQLQRHALRNPDGALFALAYISATDKRMYSATHSILVSVMCGLAAREVLNWPAPMVATVCNAALTMNLSMTTLQDRLTAQHEPPSALQRATIDGHAAQSADMLGSFGVTDATWLQAVRSHHDKLPGPLKDHTPAERMARLIQRADMFTAQLVPRTSRVPVAPGAAMQACYFDENHQVDEAGAALIKAVGIYQPGTFVRLATEEIAVVIKRGVNTTAPRVAVLINRSGMPTVEHTIRDTSRHDYRVLSSVAHRDVKITLNLERLLPLTVAPTSNTPW